MSKVTGLPVWPKGKVCEGCAGPTGGCVLLRTRGGACVHLRGDLLPPLVIVSRLSELGGVDRFGPASVWTSGMKLGSFVPKSSADFYGQVGKN